jgi:hypothetical protein
VSTQIPGESTAPLTERERLLLNRLLSDPTIYPHAFKTWLVPFLEISDMDLPMANIHGLIDRLTRLEAPVLTRVPSGTVLLYDGDQAPEGTEFYGPDKPELLAAAPPGLRFIRVT